MSIDPSILYFGTPVVLISTLGSDGRANLAPISSVFWLGHTAVLGIGTRSRTAQNLRDTGECVLNLPSVDQVAAVDRLALTTGRDPVPARKAAAGYRYEPDKFGRAGLTALPSATVAPFRAAQCPVNLEATVTAIHELGRGASGTAAVEVAVTHVHVHESHAVADNAEAYGNINYAYRSSTYGTLDASRTRASRRTASPTCRRGVRSNGERAVGLPLWARNLFDRQYYTSMWNSTFGSYNAVIGTPRTIGATARLDF